MPIVITAQQIDTKVYRYQVHYMFRPFSAKFRGRTRQRKKNNTAQLSQRYAIVDLKKNACRKRMKIIQKYSAICM